MVMKNTAQAKSTEEKSLTSGIKRVDRGAQSVETVTKKTVQRRDKNATSADNHKPKKAVKRRDKNATKTVEEPKKTVKRRDKNAITAQEEPKKKGIARSGKSGQSGHEQGLEKEKVHKKKEVQEQMLVQSNLQRKNHLSERLKLQKCTQKAQVKKSNQKKKEVNRTGHSIPLQKKQHL